MVNLNIRRGAHIEKHIIVISNGAFPSITANSMQVMKMCQAFEMLGKADVVLGPSHDGGYYLVGLKHPCPEMFDGIQWSSGRVFEASVKTIERLHKRLAVLPLWYDVDTIESLQWLKKDLSIGSDKKRARHTRRLL